MKYDITLVKSKEEDGRKYELYQIGKYKVSITTYSDGGSYANISKDHSERYLLEIYAREDGTITGFEIQTTSYGAMPADEISKVIAGLEEAMEVVKVLTEKFVKEEK